MNYHQQIISRPNVQLAAIAQAMQDGNGPLVDYLSQEYRQMSEEIAFYGTPLELVTVH